MKVEGYFSGIKKANEAVEKLKSIGINNAFVDINDHYSFNQGPRTKEYSFVSTSSLSDLVTYEGPPAGRPEKSPAAAASPMVSGMGSFEEITDINYKVIAETDESNKSKVRDLMETMGARTDNPNLNVAERIKDIKLEEMDPHYLDD